MTVKYIVGHWSGGNHKPNSVDKVSYQLLIDGNGNKHYGLPVGATASTGGMNSITYNIACCAHPGNAPITKKQIEAFYKACADKLKEFGLTPDKFYTHAEIGDMCRDGSIIKLLPHNQWLKQNIGKWDLTVLPDIKDNAVNTGNYIRNKIRWYYEKD